MTKNKYRTSGASALFGAAFIYATFGALVRIVAPMWSNEGQVAARLIVAFVVVWLVIAVRGNKVKLAGRNLWLALGLGLTFGPIMLLYTFAVQKTTLANGIFLLYAGSIVSSFLFGSIVFKEKITRYKVAAIILAFCGIGLYANALLTLSAGIVAGLVAGLIEGVSNSIRKPLAGVDRLAVVKVQYVSAALFAIVACAVVGGQFLKQVTLWGSVGTLVWGILLVCLGNLLLYGFQHFDVNIGTVILSTELVFATTIGLIFYGEVPAPHELTGGLLIFCASILSSVDPHVVFRRNKVAIE